MLYYSLYLLLLTLTILLQNTVHTEAVGEKTLDQLYQDFEENQKSCSLNDPSTKKHFEELCKGKTSPSLSNISKDKFRFDFIPYLCYSVLHNLKSACQQTEVHFKEFQPETDSSKFCTEVPKIEIQKNCTHWLEDQDKAKADCDLVSKVVGVVLNNNTCHEFCIKDDVIDPLCQDLLKSSLILANLSNQSKSQTQSELSPPTVKNKGNEIALNSKHQEETQTTVQTTKDAKSSSPAAAQGDASNSTESNGKSKAETTEVKVKNKIKDEKKEEKEEEKLNDRKIEKGGDEDEKPKEENPESRDKKPKEEEPESTDKNGDDEDETDVIVQTDATPAEIISEEKVEPSGDKASELEAPKYSGEISSESDGEAQSNFFSYFILLLFAAIVGYLVFHNKQKILALVLEGRRQQGGRRRHGGREYRKIDNSLEDTMDSGREADLRQVIY